MEVTGEGDRDQVQADQGMVNEEVQEAGKMKDKGWNPKKKRGAGRGTITLGGLHRVQKAKKR